MLMTIPNLPSLTLEVPFDNSTTSATQNRSRGTEMAAQYYAKRVDEPPNPILLPSLAAAIAPNAPMDGRYRSPYASTEPQRPPPILAPIAPMAPMTARDNNTPEPPRYIANLSAGDRTSSESQTDEHHEPSKPITIPGNNQYTPGVHRVSHPGTPVPHGPTDGTKPPRPRPHVCLTCQRTFARREHLNRHELSHTKEKPFECTECSRCFSRRDLLLRHKQKLHITNPYMRPRDRLKGDRPSDDGSEGPGMSPMAQMSSVNDGTHVPIGVHPSGHVGIGQNQDGGSGSNSTAAQDGESRGPPGIPMANMRPQLPIPRAPKPQPPGSAASLYYQKQDIDLSKLDLSRFRSLAHSPQPTRAHQPGPPPQGAPLPVSPHQVHRPIEAPRHIPINHDPEESGFHIPFAKRPRRDTDGRSRQGQALQHEQNRNVAQPGPSSNFPQPDPPSHGMEAPTSLLDQLAIAAIPENEHGYARRDQGPLPVAEDLGMAHSRQDDNHELNIWRSPGGTHRVVQFERPIPPVMLAAPDQQTRSPSQGRKRSLQEEDEGGMQIQGGYRRSMRRALSMSMEDGQRPVVPEEEVKGKKGKKAATPEKERANVKYVKAATSKANLTDKEAVSPVRGRKASASKAKEPATEEVTSEKRGRGRPPKSASASAKGKKAAKPVKAAEPKSEPEEGEKGDEEAAVEKQLLQEEKRTTRGLRVPRKVQESADTPERSFRSVRLQAKYIGQADGRK